MKSIIYLSLFTWLLTSCNTDPNANVKALEGEVIGIHDNVMPETATIQELKKQLEQMQSDNQDSLTIINLINDLDAADEAMMIWMEQYKMIDLKLDTTDNMQYLRDQKNKIIIVKEKMISAINKSNQYLKK